jgi:ribosomal protein S6
MAEHAGDNEVATRIYEVGYLVVPTARDEDVERIVSGIRTSIEKAGGSFVAEGAPSLIKLAYPMTVREGEKKPEYDRAHFGWIKFEAPASTARALEQSLINDPAIIRCMVFSTVREDTRAKMKAPQLREVKRTDTIKSTPRRATEGGGEAPVSEEQLDKALETLTAES